MFVGVLYIIVGALYIVVGVLYIVIETLYIIVEVLYIVIQAYSTPFCHSFSRATLGHPVGLNLHITYMYLL